MIDCQPPPMSYRRAEVLTLPYKRRYEKIEIMPEVSNKSGEKGGGFLLVQPDSSYCFRSPFD